MFMERVGRWVTSKPGLAILTVIVVTALMGSSIFIFGLNQTFDEEAFNPDMEIAHANTEITEDFTREYTIPVLVKSRNSNVLTPKSLVEMLEVEKTLANNSYLEDKFENPKLPSSNINSVADQIFFIYSMIQIMDMQAMEFELFNQSLAGIFSNIDALGLKLAMIDTADKNSTLRILNEINAGFSENKTALINKITESEILFGGLTGGGDGGLGPGAELLFAADYDTKIATLSSFSQDELTGLIGLVTNYDGSLSKGFIELLNGMEITAGAGFNSLGGFMFNWANVIMSPNLFNNSIYNQTLGEHYIALGYLNEINNTMTDLNNEVSDKFSDLGSVDMNNFTMQIDSRFEFMGLGLSYFLTKDFKPALGKYNAKGTLITLNFNASLGGGNEMSSGSDEQLELERKIDNIVEKSAQTENEYSVIGNGLINDIIMDANSTSLTVLLILIVVFVVALLSIIYRSLFDMGLNLLTLVFGIIWMYGAGAILGFTFNPITSMVPVMIVGLGIDYGIHITLRYNEERSRGKDIPDAMSISITWVGAALLLATITTIVAFLSNLSSPLKLLGEFGILSGVGILGCFISMVLFMPAVKQLRDLKRQRKGKLDKKKAKAKNKKSNNSKNGKVNLLDRGMGSSATGATKYPGVVLGITVLVTLGSLYSAMDLETEFNFEDFLPKGLDITDDLNFMLDEFSTGSFFGEEIVFILIKGDIADPSVLSDIQKTINNMKDDTYVIEKNLGVYSNTNGGSNGFPGGNGLQDNASANIQTMEVTSILSLMVDYAFGSRANETFTALYVNAFDENGGLRPTTTRDDILEMFMWLHINAEKDSKFVLHYNHQDDEFKKTVLRISVDTNSKDENAFKTLDELNDDKEPLDKNTMVDSAVVTGGPILFSTIMKIMNESQIRSLVITIIVCSIILTIVFWIEKRSATLGIITTLPVILVIAWSLGVMFWLGIPLNIMTITIASLTVGLGVTYGIHITHRFLEGVEKEPSIEEACRTTVLHTGTALFGAAATTIAAFGLLSFAILPPLQQFGMISAITIFFSFLSCVFILPTFLVLWAKFRSSRGTLISKKKTKETPDITPDKESDIEEVPASEERSDSEKEKKSTSKVKKNK